MFELRKRFTFEASHKLHFHDGKCARMHGHSYVLTLVLRGDSLHTNGPRTNMLVDFADISKAAKTMISTYLDHHHLNDTLDTESPTAEYIAKWIYHHLEPALPLLAEVELQETASASVIYRPLRAERSHADGILGAKSTPVALPHSDTEANDCDGTASSLKPHASSCSNLTPPGIMNRHLVQPAPVRAFSEQPSPTNGVFR